jgi:hypothetical protein
MRIEMDDGQPAVFRSMRSQQRQTDRMVAPKRDHFDAGGHKPLHLPFNRNLGRQYIDRDDVDVSEIDDAQRLKRRDPQCVIVSPQEQRLFANRPRPQPCPAAVRSGTVVRHAHDGHVRGTHVARVRPAAKRGDALIGLHGKGRLGHGYSKYVC